MDYIDEYFNKIYNFKNWKDIKRFKLPKTIYYERMTNSSVNERANDFVSNLLMRLYLKYKKIKLWILWKNGTLKNNN